MLAPFPSNKERNGVAKQQGSPSQVLKSSAYKLSPQTKPSPAPSFFARSSPVRHQIVPNLQTPNRAVSSPLKANTPTAVSPHTHAKLKEHVVAAAAANTSAASKLMVGGKSKDTVTQPGSLERIGRNMGGHMELQKQGAELRMGGRVNEDAQKTCTQNGNGTHAAPALTPTSARTTPPPPDSEEMSSMKALQVERDALEQERTDLLAQNQSLAKEAADARSERLEAQEQCTSQAKEFQVRTQSSDAELLDLRKKLCEAEVQVQTLSERAMSSGHLLGKNVAHDIAPKAGGASDTDEIAMLRLAKDEAEGKAAGIGKERDSLQQLLRVLERQNEENIKKYKAKMLTAQTEAARVSRDLEVALKRQRELEQVPTVLQQEIRSLYGEIQTLEESKYAAECAHAVALKQAQVQAQAQVQPDEAGEKFAKMEKDFKELQDKYALEHEKLLHAHAELGSTQQQVANQLATHNAGLDLLREELEQTMKAAQNEAVSELECAREAQKATETERLEISAALSRAEKETEGMLEQWEKERQQLVNQLEISVKETRTWQSEREELVKEMQEIREEREKERLRLKDLDAHLQRQLAQTEEAAGKTTARESDMQAQLQELQECQARHVALLDTARQAEHRHKEEHASMQAKIEALAEENTMKNNQLLETLEQITTLEEALSASRRTVTEQEDQHKGMKADLEARVQKEVAARQAFENSQNQMHSLEEDHQKQMRELEQMLQQMNVSSSRALQAKDDQLTRQAAQHAQELSSLKETLDVQRQEIQEAAGMAACQEAIALEDKTRDRMEQIQAQFDEWKLGLEQDKKDAIKDLESKLHTATEQANTQGEQLHAQIASLLSQVQSLQVERQLDEEVVEQVNLRQQYEIGVMTAAMDVLENRSTELEGLINLLAGALSSHASGRQDRELAVAKLTQQVKTLKEALTITQIERNRVEDERNKMEQEHDRLVVELSVARSEASEQLKAAQREHKSECSRLLADTDTRLSSEREEHRRQIQDVELLLKGARAETEEERQKKHAQASQVESMQLNLSDMLEKLEQAKKENAKMAETVNSFSQRVEAEETSRRIIAAQTAVQEKTISAMQQQRADLQKNLQEANRKQEQAAFELQRLNVHRQKASAIEEQMQHVAAERDRATTQVQELKKIAAQQKLQTRQTSERLISVERSLFDTRRALAEKNQKIADLEAKLGRSLQPIMQPAMQSLQQGTSEPATHMMSNQHRRQPGHHYPLPSPPQQQTQHQHQPRPQLQAQAQSLQMQTQTLECKHTSLGRFPLRSPGQKSPQSPLSSSSNSHPHDGNTERAGSATNAMCQQSSPPAPMPLHVLQSPQPAGTPRRRVLELMPSTSEEDKEISNVHGLTFVSPSVKAPAHSPAQLEESGLSRAPSVPSSPPIRERRAALPHDCMEAHTASPKALRQTPATKQTRAAAERENGSSGVHSQSVQNAESSVLAGIEPALPLRAGQSSDSPQRGIDLSVSFSPSQGRAAGGQSSPQRTAMSRESNSDRDRTEQGQRTAMASTYAHMHLPQRAGGVAMSHRMQQMNALNHVYNSLSVSRAQSSDWTPVEHSHQQSSPGKLQQNTGSVAIPSGGSDSASALRTRTSVADGSHIAWKPGPIDGGGWC